MILSPSSSYPTLLSALVHVLRSVLCTVCSYYCRILPVKLSSLGSAPPFWSALNEFLYPLLLNCKKKYQLAVYSSNLYILTQTFDTQFNSLQLHFSWICTCQARWQINLFSPERMIKTTKGGWTFDSIDETPWCYHSKETSLVVLSHDTIFSQHFKKWNLALLFNFDFNQFWP